MIYIEIKNSAIVFQHFLPFDKEYGLHKTEAELLKTGYLVESIPAYTGTIPAGKMPELHYDGTAFSWTMVDMPAEPLDAQTLKTRLDATDQAIVGLMDQLLTMQMGV